MKNLFFCDTALVGVIGMAELEGSITDVFFGLRPPKGEYAYCEAPVLAEAAKQLREYFSGARKAFELPLAPGGTAFQREVWEALRSIPYGETRSYKQIAQAVGNPLGSRAVGMASHNNPISLIIPCHRVIGADGGLVGYASGLNIKKKLLSLESDYMTGQERMSL